MEAIFWISVIGVSYVYFIYPLSLYFISLFYAKPVKAKYHYPFISIILCVYNEEQNIETKIKNILELDYPESSMEVLLGSDGSTDNTDAIISKYTGERIKLYRQAQRRGKPSIINMLTKKSKGDILIFTDARQRIDKSAVVELVKNFADENVGCVSAELYFEGKNTISGSGMGLYWKYEKQIRKHESKIHSMIGTTGALYAIRKQLFADLPEDVILDDVYIPMTIVKKNYRAIFESSAKVYDRFTKNPKDEFIRKTRTLSGNLQLIKYLQWLVNPFRSLENWQFWSHKLLRLVVPYLLISTFLTNIFLLNNAFYISLFVLQVIFYSLSFFGVLFKGKSRFFDIPYMLCLMNLAAVVALYACLTQKYDVLWKKTN